MHSAPIESLADGPFTLDLQAIVADIGEELVPILTPDYDDANPIKGYMTVSEYIRNHWLSPTPTAYLHQWQFPLSQNMTTKELLRDRNDDIEILGLDLLQFFGEILNICNHSFSCRLLSYSSQETRSSIPLIKLLSFNQTAPDNRSQTIHLFNISSWAAQTHSAVFIVTEGYKYIVAPVAACFLFLFFKISCLSTL